MKVRVDTTTIAIHCTATKPNLQVGVREIRQWHLDRGWEDIGYHYVICRDSTIEVGRPERYMGAHVEGHNKDSLAIVLVGGLDAKGTPFPDYTAGQMTSLRRLLDDVQYRYEKALGHPVTIMGHHDYPGVTKGCPCFNVSRWLQDGVVQPDF